MPVPRTCFDEVFAAFVVAFRAQHIITQETFAKMALASNNETSLKAMFYSFAKGNLTGDVKPMQEWPGKVDLSLIKDDANTRRLSGISLMDCAEVKSVRNYENLAKSQLSMSGIRGYFEPMIRELDNIRSTIIQYGTDSPIDSLEHVHAIFFITHFQSNRRNNYVLADFLDLVEDGLDISWGNVNVNRRLSIQPPVQGHPNPRIFQWDHRNFKFRHNNQVQNLAHLSYNPTLICRIGNLTDSRLGGNCEVSFYGVNMKFRI